MKLDSLSWATLMLSLALKGLAMKYMLVPMVLVTEMTTALSPDFARSRRLSIAGSWYQGPALHRWTWYSNVGGVAKEIDHILVSTR